MTNAEFLNEKATELLQQLADLGREFDLSFSASLGCEDESGEIHRLEVQASPEDEKITILKPIS